MASDGIDSSTALRRTSGDGDDGVEVPDAPAA